MLILLTILLLIFAPLAMLILYLVRPKFHIQGFLAVLAVLVGWIMVLLAKPITPQVITLLTWSPASFFPNSPSLLIDQISWYFALALVTLSLTVIITSIAQLGQSLPPSRTKISDRQNLPEARGSSGEASPADASFEADEISQKSNWQSWAGISILTSLGLVAVTTGNMLTLLLAWAALDVVELVISLGQVLDSKLRERIVLAFTARMAGIGAVLLVGVIVWSNGQSLSFDSISRSTSIYLLLAACLRLGVLPLHLPHIQVLPLKRGLGTTLRLIPAASSYILLVRIAFVGVLGPATPYLLGLTALAGLYAAINWISARDELNGRPFWLLGTASLIIASAILNLPAACIAWSMVCILLGGFIFSMPIHHKNLVPIVFFGIINFSALPFTPAWQGTTLYQYPGNASYVLPTLFYYFIVVAFILVHSFLMVGFIRHAFRGIFPQETQMEGHFERWVWLLYPLGLVFIVATHFFIGYLLHPKINEIPFLMWIMGFLVTIISGFTLYALWHFSHAQWREKLSQRITPLDHLLSFDWFYRLFWSLYRSLSRLSRLFSAVLEGDGGILWALVLFALIFVFLQR